MFFTGRRHAGENLNEVLRQRQAHLPLPIQMCDGLAQNEPKEFATILGNCLTHARRGFVKVNTSFPAECRFVLESLRDVYRWDAQIQELKLASQERLEFHRVHSQPVMETLHAWLKSQINEKKVESNSGLGAAIHYMLKRWEPLTLFLRQAGAPLDNNITERILKMAILHRKNSLAYKTERGARVGDMFMSLIHTCRLGGFNPFEYLKVLVQNADQVRVHPDRWLPWNYSTALGATANTS